MTSFSQYIQLIGRGRNAGKTLTRQQAFEAMSLIINDQVTPEQLGAFLMLLRVREETAEELTGFVEALRAFSKRDAIANSVDIDIACYAGKRRQLPWFLLSAACLLNAGKTLFLHGTSESDSNRLYIDQVLTKLGLANCHSMNEVNHSLNHFGAAYADISIIHPQLDKLLSLREVLGLRSCANTLARLLNPSQAKYTIQGVHHRYVDEKHAAINAYFTQQTALCFRGDGGEAEIDPTRSTSLYISKKGGSEEHQLNPRVDSWSMKDSLDNTDPLLALWFDDSTHDYGVNTVLSTLTAYLMVLEQLTEADAQKAAEQLWNKRERALLPFQQKCREQCRCA